VRRPGESTLTAGVVEAAVEGESLRQRGQPLALEVFHQILPMRPRATEEPPPYPLLLPDAIVIEPKHGELLPVLLFTEKAREFLEPPRSIVVDVRS
jgi:hypothetical protein